MIHKRQQGFSLSKLIGMIIILGPLVLIGWQIGTIYLEYFQIRRVITSIGEDVTSYDTQPHEIRRRLERTFSIDYITAVSANDLVINRRGGIISIDLVYEDRKTLFGNFKIVGDFNETIQIYP